MRACLCLLVAGLSSLGWADRVVDVPTGRSIPKDMLMMSFLEAGNQNGSRDRYVAFAPLRGLEFGARQRMRPGESGHTTFDFAYNLIAPVSSVAPGISVGMLDVANETLDGRRTYVAITFRELLQVGQKGAQGEATLGVQFGSINNGFVGVNLPLFDSLKFLVEHNGMRISAGFEAKIGNVVGLRTITQEGTLLFGLNFSHRF